MLLATKQKIPGASLVSEKSCWLPYKKIPVASWLLKIFFLHQALLCKICHIFAPRAPIPTKLGVHISGATWASSSCISTRPGHFELAMDECQIPSLYRWGIDMQEHGTLALWQWPLPFDEWLWPWDSCGYCCVQGVDASVANLSLWATNEGQGFSQD